jgi:nitronate monooxygenase
MKSTRVDQILKIKYPIIQGPFGGGLSSVELLSSVSNDGGLGSFGAHHLSPIEIKNLYQDIVRKTNKPFAINLWVKDEDENGLHYDKESFEQTYRLLKPYFDELNLPKPVYPSRFGEKFTEQIESILEIKPPVFSFVYGVPDKAILDECRKRNIVTIGTAITPDEAICLDSAGVDLIVATGFEAGGHRVSFLKEAEKSLFGTFSLIPQVVKSVRVPVIAAGGISNKLGVKAAFALGAEGVQVGTAFLATKESNAGDLHRSKIFSDEAKYTSLTRAYSGRLARGIENKFMLEQLTHAPYPAQSWFTGKLKKEAIKQGRSDIMSLWCGQGAPLLLYDNASDVFRSLLDD